MDGGQGEGPPPYPGAPNMADILAAINALALSGHQTNVQVAQMAAAVREQAEIAQRPRAQPLPRLESKNFAKLKIESGTENQKLSDLCAWEAAIRYNVESFDGLRDDLPLVRLVAAILGSLEGTARTMSQGINVDRYNEDNPANAGQNKEQLFSRFFSDLDNILLGASIPEKALSLFMARKQRKDEAIHPYHAELGILYKKAFPNAWNQPENQRALIRHFLENLADANLAYDVNINQPLPATYADALTLLEQRDGAWQRYCMAYGNRAGIRAPGAPRDPGGGGAHGNAGGPEAMDAGAFGRRGRGRGGARQRSNAPINRNQGRQAGQGQNRGQSQNRGGSTRGRTQGGQNNQGNRGGPGAPGRVKKCYACNKEGHFARECPTRVGAIEAEEQIDDCEEYEYEEVEEHYAEEDDWSPDEHPVGATNIGSTTTKPTQGKQEKGEVLYHQEPVKIIKKNEDEGVGLVHGRKYNLRKEKLKKIEKMLANPELFEKKPETYQEAIEDESKISFHPQTDDSAIAFIDGQMKKIQPPQWKEMKKTFKHYIENPLEHDHEEMQRMVQKSAESGNSKGRSIEDAC